MKSSTILLQLSTVLLGRRWLYENRFTPLGRNGLYRDRLLEETGRRFYDRLRTIKRPRRVYASESVCQSLEIPHQVITVDCSSLGSGDLAGKTPATLAPVSEWWPFRNQLLLTLAGMRAVSLSVSTLLFGSVKTDAAHADGRQEFFEKMDHVFSLQEGSLDLIRQRLFNYCRVDKTSGVPLSLLGWAHSCHVFDFACGNCRGCFKY